MMSVGANVSMGGAGAGGVDGNEVGGSLVAALPEVLIYTDGGCRPNPGPGGYGVVLIHPRKRMEASGGFRKTTNNRMELYAAITGLQLLKNRCKVTLYSDSQYVVDAISLGWAEGWKRRGGRKSNKELAANFDLWERLLALCAMHEVTFQWVRGHAGEKENERCDALSTAALRNGNLPPDEGYEKESGAPAKPLSGKKPGQTCPQCSAGLAGQKVQVSRGAGPKEVYMLCPRCGARYGMEQAKGESKQNDLLFRDGTRREPGVESIHNQNMELMWAKLREAAGGDWKEE